MLRAHWQASCRASFKSTFEALDEALTERLAHHVLEARRPVEVLPLLSALHSRFDRRAIIEALGGSEVDASFKVVAGGRQLKRLASEAHVGSPRKRLLIR